MKNEKKSEKALSPAPSKTYSDYLSSGTEGFKKEKDKWLLDHTDPVFGRPIEDCFSSGRRLEPGGMIYRVYLYQASFSPCKAGRVKLETDRFDSVEQRELFLWLESKIEDIRELVPPLLQASSDNPVELGAYFYGVPTPEEAAIAFNPEYISQIILKGENPVKWKIRFIAAIEQDVYGDIEGEDEIIRSAGLYM